MRKLIIICLSEDDRILLDEVEIEVEDHIRTIAICPVAPGKERAVWRFYTMPSLSVKDLLMLVVFVAGIILMCQAKVIASSFKLGDDFVETYWQAFLKFHVGAGLLVACLAYQMWRDRKV